jgi:predicted transposase YdaD
MPEEPVHHPHDKLFKVGFSDPETAGGLLRGELPAALAQAVDWSRLRLEPGNFIDSQMRTSASDLLFSAPVGEAECLIYILFEHQTREEPMLALRLLRYLVRIWEAWLKRHPHGPRLPAIVPVVLAHDSKAWKLSRQFASLFEIPPGLESELAPFVPDFRFQLIELADMTFESIRGTPAGIMILRTMKAGRSADWFAAPVWDEALWGKLPQEIFELLMGYIFRADVDKDRFESKLNSILEVDLRSKAMTIADQLRAEGLHKGRQEGRQEGAQDALAKAVVTALEVRFGQVPGDLVFAVKEIPEVARLEDVLRAALSSASLEDFRHRI